MRLHAETLEELSQLRWAMRNSKDVQGLYQALDDTKKQKYESLASSDKSRYDAELVKYQASLPPPPDVKEEVTKTPGMATSKRPSSTKGKGGEASKKQKRASSKREKILSDNDDEDEDDSSSEDDKAMGYESEESSDEDYLTASEGAPAPVPGALVAAPAATDYAAGRLRRERESKAAPAPAPAQAPAKKARKSEAATSPPPPLPDAAARPPSPTNKGRPPVPRPPAEEAAAQPLVPSNTASKGVRASGSKGKASTSASPFTPLPQILTKSAKKKNADAKQAEKVFKKGGEKRKSEWVAAVVSGIKVPGALKISPGDSSEDLPEWVVARMMTRSAAKSSK